MKAEEILKQTREYICEDLINNYKNMDAADMTDDELLVYICSCACNHSQEYGNQSKNFPRFDQCENKTNERWIREQADGTCFS